MPIAGASADPSRSSRRDEIRREYAEVRDALRAHCDEQFCDDDPDAPILLDSAWSLAAEWAASELETHPGSAAADLVAAEAELDPELGARAVELESGHFAISLSYSEIGTFFVVASGQPEAAWAIKDFASARVDPDDPLRGWSPQEVSRSGSWSGTVERLPAGEDGCARFYLDAIHAGNGMTVAAQLGIWEWTGGGAVPLLVEDYTAYLDDPRDIEMSGTLMRVPTKEIMETFTTGGGPEPRGILTIRVGRRTVESLGSRPEEPDFQLIDDFVVRLRGGGDVSAIAAPAVAKRLLDELRDADDSGRELGFGFLFSWKKTRGRHGEEFTMNTEAGTFRFTIVDRSGSPYVANVN